ncbi:MAG TPA: hypothetical protein P5346_01825 [Spirochaetota bacterium]|nr:hypothetical protein [Spirochaetota bacterium]HSA13453.1 hypothetical protein [Spirochaetota bacterium]
MKTTMKNFFSIRIFMICWIMLVAVFIVCCDDSGGSSDKNTGTADGARWGQARWGQGSWNE